MEKLKLPALKKVKNLNDSVKHKVGDLRNGLEVLPKEERKTILMLADDIRFFSGIATQSKMLVKATCHRYNWVNLGASINPPDAGKQFDISEDLIRQTGVEDATAKIIPNNGYGDPNLLRLLIEHEKPDAIFFVTDPRYYEWLFKMEAEIHEMGIPLIYWNIWDCSPSPQWNRSFYKACDLLLGISKQTVQINKSVLRPGNYIDDPDKVSKIDKPVTQYLKHGLDPTTFIPLNENSNDWKDYLEFRNEFAKTAKINLDSDDSFVIFWNNRNIRRKKPGDLILAYKHFLDNLKLDDTKNVVLVLHTDPVDQNGTDLPATAKAICPEYKVVFSDRKIDEKVLNFYYNMADVIPSIASNEGFGLTSCEGLMAGTPIIVNVTGGLQDQCGFRKEDGSYISVDDLSDEWMTNHDGRYKEHGDWVVPLFPKIRTLVGSVPTPYIFDDHCDWLDLSKALNHFYSMSREERKRLGLNGRHYLLEEGFTDYKVGETAINTIDTLLAKWVKPERWTIELTAPESKKAYGINYGE